MQLSQFLTLHKLHWKFLSSIKFGRLPGRMRPEHTEAKKKLKPKRSPIYLLPVPIFLVIKTLIIAINLYILQVMASI